MAVNGIEIKVGQTWLNGADKKVEIKEKTAHRGVYKWRDRDGDTYTDQGLFDIDHATRYNLVELVSEPTVAGDDHQDLTFHALPVVDMGAVSGGIGDINSNAKGTGARFNSGKPPYELIPLSIIAESYLLDAQLEGEPWHAAAALADLGEYQAGGHTGHLYTAIGELGVTAGWDECARVFEYGKRKYAEWNWAKGMPWSVPIACAARHLMAIIRGEEIDPESGLPHRGHVYCNLVMLLTYAQTYLEGDDRPPVGLLPLEFPGFPIGMDFGAGDDQTAIGVFDGTGAAKPFHEVTQEEAEADPDAVSIEVDIEHPDWVDPQVIEQCITNAVRECAARGFRSAV